MIPGLGRLLARLVAGRRGNVAVLVGLALPVICTLTVGAVELGFVVNDKNKLQDAVDAAALATAHELALATDTGVAERAKALAVSYAAVVASRSTLTAEAQVIDRGASIRVALSSHRPSFFGNLLPPGGFTTRAEATATAEGRTPLCVLGSGTGAESTLRMTDGALLKAEGCLIHSNDEITMEGSSRMEAGAVQSVGRTTPGRVTPAANVGAEPIADPFAGRNVRGPPSLCLPLGHLKFEEDQGSRVQTLYPGRYCTKIEVKRWTRLRMLPGNYYFDEVFKVDDDAELSGTDVVLVFAEQAKFEFNGRARVDLEGRKTGDLAGFLIISLAKTSKEFWIMSDHVDKLLGVIYVPYATLIVSGKEAIAEDSAWTVIVARMMMIKDSPTLFINRDYASTTVPVPEGVGPTRSSSRLER